MNALSAIGGRLAALRYPALFLVIGFFLYWTETSIDHVADGINERLYVSNRLEESARLETEAKRFFETAQLYAFGDAGITRPEVELSLNLMWSRAKVMTSDAFRDAISEIQRDPGFIGEFVVALPAFDDAVKQLKPGQPESYSAVAELQKRFSNRLTIFGEDAWNARRQRMTDSYAVAAENIVTLRRIQMTFALVSGLALIFILYELYRTRQANLNLRTILTEKQAMLRRDYLTGISNGFHFDERLGRLFQAERRDFSILYLDLDRFKQINDTFGHAAGDAVLRHVAASLKAQAREGDLVARFGGDEFAVLIAGDTARAVAFARAALAAISNPSPYSPAGVLISASAGICHASQMSGEEGQDLMRRRADLALYEAKAAGRSRLQVYGDESMTYAISAPANAARDLCA